MGYTTEFTGEFEVIPTLDSKHREYLLAFSDTRRMARDSKLAEKLQDPVREAVGLPIGKQGAYFVGGGGDSGQAQDLSIINYNNPPEGQPGLWCNWAPSSSGAYIVWNQAEKFYNYIEWLEYLIQHFLQPWGYSLDGEVTWQGENSGDMGKILVKNNEVTVYKGKVSYRKVNR